MTVAVFCWELGHGTPATSTPWHHRDRGEDVTSLSPSFPFPSLSNVELLHGWRSGRDLLSKCCFLLLKLGFFHTRMLQVELPCHTCSPSTGYWWWSLLTAHPGCCWVGVTVPVGAPSPSVLGLLVVGAGQGE